MSYVYRDTYSVVNHGISQTVHKVDKISDAEVMFWLDHGITNTAGSRIFAGKEPWGWDIADIIPGEYVTVRTPYTDSKRFYDYECDEVN